MTNHYDIIIIGTGSGGSTMAYKLAPSGKKILILERGAFIPKEKENWDPHEVVTKGRYRPDDTWYDGDDKPFKPFIHYNVGGNSKMFYSIRCCYLLQFSCVFFLQYFHIILP